MAATASKTGTVKWFSEQKGYGFISRDDGREDLFVHHTAIDGKGFRMLKEGDRVEFTEAPGRKGLKANTCKVLCES